MTHIVDNLIAFKILYMLVTPFVESKAFKLGVIDANGKVLIKLADRTQEQKDAYDVLDKLVFSLKRLLAKLPGGDNKFKSLVTAYFLVKEAYQSEVDIDDSYATMRMNESTVFVEEEIEVARFLTHLREDGEGSPGVAVANISGEKVSTDVPLKPLGKMFRRKKKPCKV